MFVFVVGVFGVVVAIAVALFLVVLFLHFVAQIIVDVILRWLVCCFVRLFVSLVGWLCACSFVCVCWFVCARFLGCVCCGWRCFFCCRRSCLRFRVLCDVCVLLFAVFRLFVAFVVVVWM